MDLLEFQGKQFFSRFGIPVPSGSVAREPDRAVEIADGLGYPVVIKAQVHAGGRGKAGGIRLAANPSEVAEAAGSIIGMEIGGHRAGCVLVEEAAPISAEYYASFTLDRSARQYLGILSARGGVDIEQVAASDPDAIARIGVNPVVGLAEEQALRWIRDARLDKTATDGTMQVLLALYDALVEGDADLVEINPLILTPDGEVRALDAKVTLDGNSRFRHPEYEEYDRTQPRDHRERSAHDRGLQYVGLDGTVGVIANGAGLAMSTVDVISQAGGSAANFLDIGGGADVETMAAALEVINGDRAVRAIFINIFGGIVKGQVVARGILDALERVTMRSPIVLRLDGTNAPEGRAMIEPFLSERLMLAASMPEGAAQAVKLARRGS